jgi:putative ABC transport system permease protein
VTGGVLGLAIGVGASFLGTNLLGDLIGVTTFLPAFAPWLVFGSVGLSFVLGACAGVWPAWHAARLDPVQALSAD